MDIKKILLYAVVVFLGFSIWKTWQTDYRDKTINIKAALSSQSKNKAASKDYVPDSYESRKSNSSTVSKKSDFNLDIDRPIAKKISLKSDVLQLAVNLQGGSVVSAKLLEYPLSTNKKQIPVQILKSNHNDFYIADSGLTGLKEKQVFFHSPKKSYTLSKGKNYLNVTISGRTKSGLKIQKTFSLTRGKYAIKQTTLVINKSGKAWHGNFYHQLMQKTFSKTKLLSRYYSGASISSPDVPYRKLPFKTLDKSDVSQNIKNGWIAMQEPYFLSAWIPDPSLKNHYFSHVLSSEENNNLYVLGYVSPQVKLLPGKSASSLSVLYVGPELEEQLSVLAHGLDLTIDYGWFWFLSKPIFYSMSEINHFLQNWGYSIIVTTLLIKLIFYPLSSKSYRSMAKMREIAPRLQALRERYKNDKQGLGKATVELYKREKVNPAGGCLPMIIQIPVFIALYWVLIESVQLRQAPFIFWVKDLSVKDPYFVLPILMGLSMLIQQKLSPSPSDPNQAKIMMVLPIVFTIFFTTFPAGLVLYWLTNNCLSVLQQWYVIKRCHPNSENQKTGK